MALGFNAYPALQIPGMMGRQRGQQQRGRIAQQELGQRQQRIQLQREQFEYKKHALMTEQQRTQAGRAYGFVLKAVPALMKVGATERAAMIGQVREQGRQAGLNLDKFTDQQLMDPNYLKAAYAQTGLKAAALKKADLVKVAGPGGEPVWQKAGDAVGEAVYEKPEKKEETWSVAVVDGNSVLRSSRGNMKKLPWAKDEDDKHTPVYDADGNIIATQDSDKKYHTVPNAMLPEDEKDKDKPTNVTFDVMERDGNKIITQLRGDDEKLDEYMADPKYHVRRTPTVQAGSVADLASPGDPGGKKGREAAQKNLSMSPYNMTQMSSLQRQYRSASGAAGVRGAVGRVVGGLAGQVDPELGEFATEAIADVSARKLANLQTQARTMVGQNIENITGDDSGRYSDRDLKIAEQALATVSAASSVAQIQGALDAVVMMEYVAQERDLIRLGHVPVELTKERVEKIGNTLKSVYELEDETIREIIQRIFTLHKGHKDITGG